MDRALHAGGGLVTSHADTLRHMAEEKFIIRREAYDHPDRDALLAGAEALDTLRQVRDVVTDRRDQREAALQRWDDTGDPWDGATSDTLHDTIHLLTEALKGDTE